MSNKEFIIQFYVVVQKSIIFSSMHQEIKLVLNLKSNLHIYTRDVTPEASNEWRGPYPRLSAWATQLRRNAATVASHGDTVFCSTGPRIEQHTFCTDSNVLTLELAGRLILNLVIS